MLVQHMECLGLQAVETRYYQWRRWPASGTSGSIVMVVCETVESVRPLNSPTLAFLSARTECTPLLKLCNTRSE